MQCFMSEFLGRDVELVDEVDNTQAIAAVEGGYSQKLKHITRTHRVNIGFLHDLFCEGDNAEVEYCPSSEQEADIFTKCLGAVHFAAARAMIGVGPDDDFGR